MAEILEKTAGSVGDILSSIDEIARVWTPSFSDPEDLWFRGQPKRNQQLLPSLYRDHARGIHYDEEGMFERFKALAVPFVEREPRDDWDWYFLARHHSLPSRLLDWSESALAAAFFALKDTICTFPTRIEMDKALDEGRQPALYDDDSPTIWMLDAGTLNRCTCSPSDDYPFAPGGSLTSSFLPATLSDRRSDANQQPIALLPPRANIRLSAQQGVFTLHGHSIEALESIARASLPPCEVRLARIVIDRSNATFVCSELSIAGVNRLALFPDLDSVAEHVKWAMQSRKSMN